MRRGFEAVVLPCAALDSRAAKYWQFSVNELGELDIAAQIDYIHMVKTDELREIYGEGTASVEDLPPSTLPYDSLGDGCGLQRRVAERSQSIVQRPSAWGLSSRNLCEPRLFVVSPWADRPHVPGLQHKCWPRPSESSVPEPCAEPSAA